MFLVNSRHHHFSAACLGYVSANFTQPSTPSSEVTGLFCRIPWPEFSRAPWIIHPTHLSWFTVRFACTMLRRFSWQPGLYGSSNCYIALASRLSFHYPRIYLWISLHVCTKIPTPRPHILLRLSFTRTYKYENY